MPATSFSCNGFPADQDKSLLSARKGDHDDVVKAGRGGNGIEIRDLVIAVEPVQMDRRRRHLTPREPTQSGLASLRQGREPRAARAQGPLQQRIMTASDDRRRGRVGEGWHDQSCRQPAVERCFGE